ncbi:MAG TPA: toll/interleukin-1 receptor domain-containing protein, partial [Longimicrobiaceae bacterium]|nr:toll/interleukin-1 receptor domain-containing protein [Longimicrobiaceae bacterium]
MARVFLSHASADAALADAVHDALAAAGHEVFLDHHRDDGIAAGAEWERVLYEELDRADALVCVVTAAYVGSRWCFAEIALAKSRGRLIVPLTAADGAPHPLLAPAQALAYGADPAAATARLLDRLSAVDAGGGAAWDPARAVY